MGDNDSSDSSSSKALGTPRVSNGGSGKFGLLRNVVSVWLSFSADVEREERTVCFCGSFTTTKPLTTAMAPLLHSHHNNDSNPVALVIPYKLQLLPHTVNALSTERVSIASSSALQKQSHRLLCVACPATPGLGESRMSSITDPRGPILYPSTTMSLLSLLHCYRRYNLVGILRRNAEILSPYQLIPNQE